MSGTPDALAPAPSTVNGPEDGLPEWDQVDWGQAEENVRRLRQRIFAASQAGDLKKGPQPAEDDAPVPQQRAGERAAGHGGQRWPQDGRGRRAPRARELGEGRLGRLAAARDVRVEAAAGQAGVCAQEQRPPSRPRDTSDRRPGPSGPGGERAGTGVGVTVRAEILRFPARPGLPRRDRGHPHHRERQVREAGMGAGRRPPVGVRPAQPRSHPHVAGHLPRTGPGAPVAGKRA